MDTRRTIPWIFSVLLAVPTLANAVSGASMMTGTATLVVNGCGSHRAPLSAAVTIGDDGNWSSVSRYGTLAGTYALVGKSGRKLKLTLDTHSTLRLIAEIVAEVEAACQLPAVTVKSVPVRMAVVTIARSLTTAKLAARWVVKGKAGRKTGTATLKLRTHGNWSGT